MVAFNAAKHDIGIDSVGYMVVPGSITRTDAVPATARVASGEGRYDTFQTESYYAQAAWGGGAGQARFVAPDQFLCGIGDGAWGGTYFPGRKKITEANGGSAFWYGERSGTLYGWRAAAISQIGSATTQVITSGTPLCKPVESAAHNVIWATNESGTAKVRKWDGSTITDITPTSVTPSLVAAYGRAIYCFGQRTLTSTPALQQSIEREYRQGVLGPTTQMSATWSAPTRDTAYLLMVLYFSTSGITPTVPTAWGLTPIISKVDATAGDLYVYAIENAQSRSGGEVVNLSGSTNGWMLLIEPKGLLQNGVLDVKVATQVTGTAANPTVTGVSSGTLSQAKNLALSFWGVQHTTNGVTSMAPDATSTFTESQDFLSSESPAKGAAFNYLVTAATTAINDVEKVTAASSFAYVATNILIVLRGNALTADLLQTSITYTLDDGATWTEVFQGDSAGIPVPIAALATQGYLWLTTSRGLYQMNADEHEFEDHQVKFIVAIVGPVDKWDLPFNSGATGTWLATFNGLLYYNVGATLRQFAPGGTGRQVWPSPEWNTVVGQVQAIVAGEGGVYFGAAGFLWRYDEKGLMPLAAEPAANDFDYLQWSAGKLYFNDDPASYFNFQYPSSRPDIALSAPANFTTGYMITSSLDFEKTSENKVMRQFETQGYFTGGTNESTGGSILAEYAVGDGIQDPGKQGGAAASTTWVTIGKQLVTDNGIKRTALATPLVAKKIYIRITLTPGSVGYPVLTAMIANGRALMPSVKRFTATLNLTSGLLDRAGGELYGNATDVNTAIDTLETLRTTGTYFTVNYLDDDGTTTDYVCTFDQKQDTSGGYKGTSQMRGQVAINLLEVP